MLRTLLKLVVGALIALELDRQLKELREHQQQSAREEKKQALQKWIPHVTNTGDAEMGSSLRDLQERGRYW